MDEQIILDHLLLISEEDSHSSFQIIYNHYYHKLFRQALSYFTDPDIAQEIVSDIFVSLWQARSVLNKVKNPDAYLFIALKNARAKYVARNYNERNELLLEQLPETNSVTDAEIDLIHTELQKKYLDAVNNLPPRCAEVFRLVREEKKKYAEVAEQLQISTKTVDNQMTKAVKLLYAELKDHLFLFFL